MVYVIGMNGLGLSPTTERKARILLKQGKASVARKTPFTIHLLYKTGCATTVTHCGTDTGSQHIGKAVVSVNSDSAKVLSKEEFSMRSFMRGNAIHFNAKLDETSNPNEAYLRTWGWSPYISVWYLYFRKVNFPVDPEIHGRWEWAGIRFGEKL